MATATSSIRNWFTPQRWWSAAYEAVSRAWPPSRPWSGSSPTRQHPFDRRHGVDTGGVIYDLTNGHEHDIHNSGYYATAPSLFRGAMEQWRGSFHEAGLRLEDYTFVDVGCGKGRAVMLAAEYAFRAVVGVELNPELAEVARRNLRRWLQLPRACGNVCIVEQDALSAPIPDGPVVLFFFNSFEREMVRMWLERLVAAAATRTQPIDVMYLHPEHADLFRSTPGIELQAHAEIRFSPEDAAADVFGVDFDWCAVYRLGL